ncbi:uncharacterized protein LOC128540767 [Clarias gariepinus]|uniref:uncharacterized protein LOC128540767 n=1 Tax=Clarias gariepinus TaxID=13013 RepID=UPI00234CF3BB|nr:uncharacterized protein LOC128540767 [Clarias gariepinus]
MAAAVHGLNAPRINLKEEEEECELNAQAIQLKEEHFNDEINALSVNLKDEEYDELAAPLINLKDGAEEEEEEEDELNASRGNLKLNASVRLLEHIEPLVSARKRKRSVPTKEREVMKQKRHDGSGKEPIIACNHVGEKFCRASSLSKDDLLQNFSLFYETANKEKQDEGILRLVNLSLPKRIRVSPNAAKRPRNLSITYFLLRKGSMERVPVCKATFISVLGISKDRVARVCQYFAAHCAPRPELRGGPRNVEQNKAKRDSIRQHISQFQCQASHYGRKDSPGCKYLPSDLTVAKMYSLFKEQHHCQISYSLYYSVFKSDFNLGFGHPADVC